jgi:hypothetical protein
MPNLPLLIVRRAWRMRSETGRIHLIAVYADGKDRHLYVDQGGPWYEVLNSHLLAQGYTGPLSGAHNAANDQPRRRTTKRHRREPATTTFPDEGLSIALKTRTR